jgi:hypothetical protein
MKSKDQNMKIKQTIDLIKITEGKKGKMNRPYLKEQISGPSERLDSPISHFVQKSDWGMMLRQIN